MKYQVVDSPDFMENLVVYELCTKNFTTINGIPQSGTFRSLLEKIDYLAQLNVNSIWLNGHQLCNKHFANLWCQYACVRPDRIDPSLGSEDDFKLLINYAHQKGIRIFLDVIAHGVVRESELIEEHPHWFCGGTWGMVDFDWYGNHEDLDSWWVDTWTQYVLEYNIDGYRIDVSHYRSDLWALIRKRCADAGHQIMIMLENGPATCGVSDTLQHAERLSDNRGFYPNHRILRDAAGHFLDKQYNLNEHYTVKVIYRDGTFNTSYRKFTTVDYSIDLLQASYKYSYIRHMDCDRYGVAYEEEMGIICLENVEAKPIADVIISDAEGHMWHLDMTGVFDVDFYIEIKGNAPSIELHFPIRQQKGQYISNQLSCHDNGWEGYSESTNAYAAKGSRFVIGYGFALAPAIPVFMSGEEFNSDYKTLPGGDDTSKWMLQYNLINWDELKIPEKQKFLEDVKSFFKIRKDYPKLMKALRMGIKGNLHQVNCSADGLPVPYMYFDGETGILVAGNPDKEKDVEAVFNLESFFDASCVCSVEVLFGMEKKTFILSVDEISKRKFTIGADSKSFGGVLVLKFTKAGEASEV